MIGDKLHLVRLIEWLGATRKGNINFCILESHLNYKNQFALTLTNIVANPDPPQTRFGIKIEPICVNSVEIFACS